MLVEEGIITGNRPTVLWDAKTFYFLFWVLVTYMYSVCENSSSYIFITCAFFSTLKTHKQLQIYLIYKKAIIQMPFTTTL